MNLHILTRDNDPLASKIVEQQRQQAPAADDIQVFDLSKPDPDYQKLLETIFAADSIAVW